MTHRLWNLFIKLRRNKALSLGEQILIGLNHISVWSSFSMTHLELIFNFCFSRYRFYHCLLKIKFYNWALSHSYSLHYGRGCRPSSPAGGHSCCSTHPWGAHGCGVSHLLPGVQPAQQMSPDAGVPPRFLHRVPPEDPAVPQWTHWPIQPTSHHLPPVPPPHTTSN